MEDTACLEMPITVLYLTKSAIVLEAIKGSFVKLNLSLVVENIASMVLLVSPNTLKTALKSIIAIVDPQGPPEVNASLESLASTKRRLLVMKYQAWKLVYFV